jgi:hypothetical protein
LAQMAKGMDSIPRRTSPLLAWRTAYGQRTDRAARPTVARSGSFRGNRWPKLKPAYKRKTDGRVVPVWGGVPRLRAGRVTRVASGGQRYGHTLTPSQNASGFGVIKKGQTFTGRNVLARLKGDGSRYKSSDKQLGKVGARSGLLGDWVGSDPIVDRRGKRIRITSNKAYAGTQHKRRPFASGRKIDREESRDLLTRIARYVDKLMRGQRA